MTACKPSARSVGATSACRSFCCPFVFDGTQLEVYLPRAAQEVYGRFTKQPHGPAVVGAMVQEQALLVPELGDALPMVISVGVSEPSSSGVPASTA